MAMTEQPTARCSRSTCARGSPCHRPVPVVFPSGEPATAKLHPQPLPLTNDEPGRNGGPLCVVDLRAAPACDGGQGALEGGGGGIRRHAERQRQRVRVHAKI